MTRTGFSTTRGTHGVVNIEKSISQASLNKKKAALYWREDRSIHPGWEQRGGGSSAPKLLRKPFYENRPRLGLLDPHFNTVVDCLQKSFSELSCLLLRLLLLLLIKAYEYCITIFLGWNRASSSSAPCRAKASFSTRFEAPIHRCLFTLHGDAHKGLTEQTLFFMPALQTGKGGISTWGVCG